MLGYYSVIMKDKPLAYYRLSELSGTSAFDSSVNSNTGTISGGVTLNQAGVIKGDPNKGMLFDGVNGVITLPLVTNATHDITLEAWAYLPSSSIHGVILKIGSVSGSGGYGIGIGGGTWDSNGTQFVAAIEFGSWNPAPGGASLSTLTWHHLVWILRPNNVATSTYYVDGALIGSASTIAPQTPATGCYIGNDPDSSTRHLNATLDEVAIYNQTGGLTADQVARHYHAGVNGNVFMGVHHGG